MASIFTLGTLDCVTTSIGIAYRNLVELNPLMSQLIDSSLYAFILIKMIAVVCITALFYISQLYVVNINKGSKHYKTCFLLINIAFTVLVIAMLLTVINNTIQLIRWW
jgi:hypothetical protein